MHEFIQTLSDRKGELVTTIFEHIQLSFIALLIAALIGVPLGILLTKTKKLSEIGCKFPQKLMNLIDYQFV